MADAVASSLGIVAYLALFAGVAVVFLAVNLLVGRLLRADNPFPEKQEIYECGEPTIGSSFVQFDLRFYVVALLFIIFDVEVAFFFPWATVFGKATNLMNERAAVVRQADTVELTGPARGVLQEMGVASPQVPETVPATLQAPFAERFSASAPSPPLSKDEAEFVVRRGARQLALTTIIDIGVFFAVLMVGFFYVWKRGDLDWVRATGERTRQRTRPASGESAESPVSLSV